MYAESTITTIGKTNWRNSNIVFGIKDIDRMRSIYCLGKTGVGKTTLMLHMAIQDIERGNGLCVLDPHGDAVQTLLDYVPSHRIEDVIYFDAITLTHCIPFNPLYRVPKEQQHIVASNLIATFKKIWIESWGVRLEYILHNALLTLLEYQEASLLDVKHLLTDKSFRRHVLEFVHHRHVRSFWLTEFDSYSNTLRIEAISPILNKMGVFNTNPVLASIVGQPGCIDIASLIQNRKILLCNLSKGLIGEEVSSLLGSMLLTAIQQAAFARSAIPVDARIPFYVYVDEAHSFLTPTFISILAEARKFKLSLFLTHQYLDQMPLPIRSAIFGNVGTLITFATGSVDAEFLEKELQPVFSVSDIISLPKFHFYLKLMIDGMASKPFSACTLPLSNATYQNSEALSKRTLNSQNHLVRFSEQSEKKLPPTLFT